MKLSLLAFLCFICMFTFAQTESKQKGLINTISTETCNCATNSTTNDGKAFLKFDSCYKAIIAKYADSLQKIGLNITSAEGEDYVLSAVILKTEQSCITLMQLMKKEFEAENLKKEHFTGTITSQTKLPSGKYEIILYNGSMNTVKLILSGYEIKGRDNKDIDASTQITVSYKPVYNESLQKEENVLQSYSITSITTQRNTNTVKQ